MPQVFRQNGFRFFFYANEGDPREPPHVRVEKGDDEAKIWLRPQIRLGYNDGFDARTLRDVLALVEAHRVRIEKVWNEFFAQRHVGSF